MMQYLTGEKNMEKQLFFGKWGFILRETRNRILLSIFLFLFLLFVVIRFGTDWWNSVEPVITFLTLGVALFVVYQQMTEEWEEDYLPKKFSGEFYFEGKKVMRFENAMLTTEGDIRALAQQIGQQMAKTQFLKFIAPEVEVTGPFVNKQELFIHYNITIKLIELPDELKKIKFRLWKYPFMNENGSPNYKDEQIPNS